MIMANDCCSQQRAGRLLLPEMEQTSGNARQQSENLLICASPAGKPRKLNANSFAAVRHSRRAQTVFLDLFFAVGFFLLVLGLIMITSINLKYKSEQNLIRDDLERKAVLITDLLVYSPGYPSAWETNSSAVETFGLAGLDHEIIPAKLMAFKKLADSNYTRAKDILGIAGDEFYLQFRYQNQTILTTTGNVTPEGHVINMRRAVTYNNQKSLLIFTIWRLE